MGHVILKKNSLIQVVCMLRFPSLLEIEQNLPVNFQKPLRDLFPKSAQTQEPDDTVNINLPPANRMPGAFILQQRKNYQFTSSDTLSSVGLTKDYVAVMTSAYSGWDNFKENICVVLHSLHDAYDIQLFSHIELRYVNLITKQQYNLPQDTPWSELISPQLVGLLDTSGAGGTIYSSETSLYISYPDSQEQIFSHVGNVFNPQKEPAFVIDCNAFLPISVNSGQVLNVLDSLHEKSHSFLNYSLTEKMYKLMEPES